MFIKLKKKKENILKNIFTTIFGSHNVQYKNHT